LILVLFASGLQGAVSHAEAVPRLDWVLAMICLSSAYYLAKAVSDFKDERRAWRKSLGEDVGKIHLDLCSRYLDFDRHIGRFGRGSSTA
jgi:hypothetical protein